MNNPAFWKWLMKVDLIYMDFIGADQSIVEQTGCDCWYMWFDDGESPYWSVVEDIRAGF